MSLTDKPAEMSFDGEQIELDREYVLPLSPEAQRQRCVILEGKAGSHFITCKLEVHVDTLACQTLREQNAAGDRLLVELPSTLDRSTLRYLSIQTSSKAQEDQIDTIFMTLGDVRYGMETVGSPHSRLSYRLTGDPKVSVGQHWSECVIPLQITYLSDVLTGKLTLGRIGEEVFLKIRTNGFDRVLKTFESESGLPFDDWGAFLYFKLPVSEGGLNAVAWQDLPFFHDLFQMLPDIAADAAAQGDIAGQEPQLAEQLRRAVA